MGLTHCVGKEAARHRFHTLAFPGKQQAGAIGLQRDHAIQVPRGLRQAIQIGREAFLLGAWRNRMGAHDQQLNIQEWQTGWSFSSRYPVYNTVVLGQLVHCSVEQVRILKVGLIARLLVRNRLQTSREWFVPLRRERSNVSEDTFYLIEADLAWERDRIQAGATNGRVSEQRVDVVGGLSPALC